MPFYVQKYIDTAEIVRDGTLAGGVGLVIAALGSWTRSRGISRIALVSVLVVLPAAMLYGWQSVHAFWINTQLGMHYGLWAWASAILPPFLCLVAAGLSWIRFRRLSSLFLPGTTALGRAVSREWWRSTRSDRT